MCYKSIVVVVSSINYDIINQVDYHDHSISHFMYNKEGDKRCPGGHGANQAVALLQSSRFKTSDKEHTADTLPVHVQVHLIGMIGTDDDNRGPGIIKELAEKDIHLEVEPLKSVGTGYAHIEVDRLGKNRVGTQRLANEHLTWEIVESRLRLILEKHINIDMILVQLEIPVSTTSKTLDFARKNKIKTVFNPAPYHRNNNLLDEPRIFDVDHLILNHSCAERLLSSRDAKDNQKLEQYPTNKELRQQYLYLCGRFHQLGAKCVVITLSHRGVFASRLELDEKGDEGCQTTFMVPGKRLNSRVTDETGASDAFIGAYAVEILMFDKARQMMREKSQLWDANMSILAALQMGVRAGGWTVHTMGSSTAMPWRGDLLGEDWITSHPVDYDLLPQEEVMEAQKSR